MSIGSGILLLGCAYGYLYFKTVWETRGLKLEILFHSRYANITRITGPTTLQKETPKLV